MNPPPPGFTTARLEVRQHAKALTKALAVRRNLEALLSAPGSTNNVAASWLNTQIDGAKRAEEEHGTKLL
jgi:hypothetical protein